MPQSPPAISDQDKAVIRENREKLLDAAKELNMASSRLNKEMESSDAVAKELKAEHDKALAASRDIADSMALLAGGRSAVERQKNRQQADQLALRKRDVDSAVLNMKLRLSELEEMKTQLATAAAEVAKARSALTLNLGKIKEVLGEERSYDTH